MGFYSRNILPKIIDCTCSMSPNMKQREKIVPLATGTVLEIGIGSGLNLPYYDPDKVDEVIGLDPYEELWSRHKFDTGKLNFNFRFLRAGAEQIPLPGETFDTIVLTYTLCSLIRVERSLEEARRVLKPGGKILFSEHGLAPDTKVRRWQNTINPVWKRIGGGCNLNRDIPQLFIQNGFQLHDLHQQYIPGWKPASYTSWGAAIPNP